LVLARERRLHASRDVHGGYLYPTLTETLGNIWMLHGGPTPLHAAR